MQSGHPSEVHSRGMQRPSHVENDVEQLKVNAFACVVVEKKENPPFCAVNFMSVTGMSMTHVID